MSQQHTLIFDRRGLSLEYENRCLIVREPPHAPRSLPLSAVSRIVCCHSVQLTTALLGQLWSRGIDFVVLNQRYSDHSFALYPNQQRQVERRSQQYRWQHHPQPVLPMAILLCQHRLTRNLRQLTQPDCQAHPLLIQALSQTRQQMLNAHDIDQLRGMEGQAQRQVFEYWRQQLPDTLGFQRRQRRPPTDPVNALLSLTYSMAMQQAIRACTLAGLDSQLGFYHRIAYGRHSLACDLMETIRPDCEVWVMQRFIVGDFAGRHFNHSGNRKQACLLGKPSRSRYYQMLGPKLLDWQPRLNAAARWVCNAIDRSLSSTTPSTR